MPIIATVGRRSFSARTLIAAIYLLLTLGGLSMVYPFALMLATATTTPADCQEYRLVPAYFHDDQALYRKYLWLRYDTGAAGGSADGYNLAYPGAAVSDFRRDECFGHGDRDDPASAGLAIPPTIDPADPQVRARAADLDRFLLESAALWPGEPLTRSDGRPVLDPLGRPLDPAGLSTGLGNRYRTVGYVGALYVGLAGPGREQWTEFLRQLYADPDRPDEGGRVRLDRLVTRLGRPYQDFAQVRPGYDVPNSATWSILRDENLQLEWLAFKAVYLTGAPVAGGPAAAPVAARPQAPASGSTEPSPAITPQAARVLDAGRTVEHTDALGRSGRWTVAHDLRAVRPTQVAPILWRDLRDRYLRIEQLNLALGLARRRPAESPYAPPAIEPTGRDVVVAKLARSPDGSLAPEGPWLALARALLLDGRQTPTPRADSPEVRYLPPPRLDPAWGDLIESLGLGPADAVERFNERLEHNWVRLMADHGYRVERVEPFAAFEDVCVPPTRPPYEPLAAEWDRFVSARVPPQMIVAGGAGEAAPVRLQLPCHAWAEFLRWVYPGPGGQAEFRARYLGGIDDGQLADLLARRRALFGRSFDAFDLAAMPIPERDRIEFEAHASQLRRGFALGNFRVVLDELVLEGRAMFNTIVLIVLAIVTHVTVNPLAAYALSRFRLRYSYKVLVLLLATMAFPPAVGMIPGFLLLKHFGLINTYAALVLPGIASGYTIFLLKGFFDALPQELYEAAEIDGAGKITTFLNVTFPLSKPIFAILVLGSFTAAYSGFMWAFLICPDAKMWTVMVHLFNIQQTATAPIAMAALVVAAIPTFLVFLFCQNVILRGIIVPSFK